METYQNILVVIDENDFGTKAISRAVSLIERTHGRMSILLMEHHSKLSRFSNLFNGNKRIKITNQGKKVRLRSIINKLTKKRVKVNPELLTCDSCEDVLEEASRKNIDTIVVAASNHEYGFSFHNNSIDSLLLGNSPTSLLIVKDHNWQPNGHILSAIELLSEAQEHQILTKKVLEESEHLTKLLNGDCHMVDCYYGEYVDMSFKPTQVETNKDTHRVLMEKYCHDYHLPIENIHMSPELPEHAIIHIAKEIDSELIILGDCGHRGFLDTLSTHVSVEVLSQVNCDLLVLKP